MEMVALRNVPVEQPPKHRQKSTQEKPVQSAQPSLFDTPIAGVVADNGQPRAVVPVARTPVDEQQDDSDEQRRIEVSIKHEVLRTLSDRAARFLQVRAVPRTPDSPFAAPAAECAAQFRDGHYFGCIALTQAVLEAVIHHIWQVKIRKTPHQKRSFEHNLNALHKKQLISEAWKSQLDQMWADRYRFSCLRPSEESERQQLETMARHLLTLLNELEQAFFGFAVQEGMVLPQHPEYWSLTGATSGVFMGKHE